jgi:hypothetical protein
MRGSSTLGHILRRKACQAAGFRGSRVSSAHRVGVRFYGLPVARLTADPGRHRFEMQYSAGDAALGVAREATAPSRLRK